MSNHPTAPSRNGTQLPHSNPAAAPAIGPVSPSTRNVQPHSAEPKATMAEAPQDASHKSPPRRPEYSRICIAILSPM